LINVGGVGSLRSAGGFSLGVFGVFTFCFWCNTWDLIPFYIYKIYFAIKK